MSSTSKEPISVSVPITEDAIRALRAGDAVLLNGVLVTGRDAAHKWLHDCFISRTQKPTKADAEIYGKLKQRLDGGVIYHCGPVVAGLWSGEYRFVSSGPTTSAREEPYQADIIQHFNLRGVLGKGGMGARTLAACVQAPAVYFHAVGGAAALMARSVTRVWEVFRLDFGVPEALWVIEVKDLPAFVTMDAHGASLHEQVAARSRAALEQLI